MKIYLESVNQHQMLSLRAMVSVQFTFTPTVINGITSIIVLKDGLLFEEPSLDFFLIQQSIWSMSNM